MDFGILKIMGIMFFIPGCIFALIIGDCLKTRSLSEIKDYPVAMIIIFIVELLAIWGLFHLNKTAKGQKPVTIDEIPAQIAGKDPKAYKNDRMVFFVSTATHVLGIVSGFLLAWTRYRT